MKRLGIEVLGLMVAFLAFFAVGCDSENGGDSATDNSASSGTEGGDMSGGTSGAADMVKEGERLVTVLGCNDCHTTKKMTPQGEPVPDESMLLAGHPASMQLPAHDPALVAPGKWILADQSFTAYVGPWGTSFAANLTPDPTGLGGWTEARFVKAMREGKYMGMDSTRVLLPPMPWPGFTQLTDNELKAIFAYLQSIKPIENAVPAPIPPAGAPGQAGAGGGEGQAKGASTGA